MARSARRLAPLAALLAIAAGLGGCVSTQRLDERAQLRATRLLAARRPLRVTRADPAVRVGQVTVLRGAARTAIVVTLSNVAARALSDLPISVGYARGRRRAYLNAGAGLGYFETHVPFLAARGAVRWVLTTRRAVPRSARPFALVGIPREPAPGTAGAAPRLAAGATRAGRGAIAVRVRDDAGVPQDDLPLYVFATRDGRYVAAGRATLAHLGAGASATVLLRLVGAARSSAVTAEALPTILR